MPDRPKMDGNVSYSACTYCVAKQGLSECNPNLFILKGGQRPGNCPIINRSSGTGNNSASEQKIPGRGR